MSPSDGQSAPERRSRGEKGFPQVRCPQERGSEDGETEAVPAERVHWWWRVMGEDRYRNVVRQEPRAGPGRAGEEDADPAHGRARGAAGLGEGAEMQ